MVVMAVDKRCVATRRALQAKSAVSKIQHVKNNICKKLQNQANACMKVCGNEFTTR